MPTHSANRRPSATVLRVGYVPLVHAAPLLVARNLGLFSNHGIQVRLSAEVGWATIREKIISGELDAAQALAPMPLAMALGQGSARCDCLTALVLTVHGNTLVLSKRLWNETQGDPAQLHHEASRETRIPTFGVVYQHSTQHFLLREWLGRACLVPGRDYRVVVVPPQQMVAHLKAGHIDGCSMGEPWGSLAVRTGVGVVAALSADLAPGHPEKVLLVRRSFANDRADAHRALVRALLDACAWCAHPDHRSELVALLARREALGTPPEVLESSLLGRFDLGAGRSTERSDIVVFHGDVANEPSASRAAWLASHFDPQPPPALIHRVYDAALHRSFRLNHANPSPHEHTETTPA